MANDHTRIRRYSVKGVWLAMTLGMLGACHASCTLGASLRTLHAQTSQTLAPTVVYVADTAGTVAVQVTRDGATVTGVRAGQAGTVVAQAGQAYASTVIPVMPVVVVFPSTSHTAALFYDPHTAFLSPVIGRVTSCRFNATGCNVAVTMADTALVRWRPDVPDPVSGNPSLEVRFRSPAGAGGSKNAYVTRKWSRYVTSWAFRSRLRFDRFTTVGDDGTCPTCPAPSYKLYITAPYLEPTGREGWIFADTRLFQVFNQGRSGSGIDSGSVSVNVHEVPWTRWWPLDVVPAGTPSWVPRGAPPWWTTGRWQDVTIGVAVTSDSTAVQFTFWTDADSLARGLTAPQLRHRVDVRIPSTRVGSNPRRWRVVGTDTTFRFITGVNGIQSANYNKPVVDAHDGMAVMFGDEDVYDLRDYPRPWPEFPRSIPELLGITVVK